MGSFASMPMEAGLYQIKNNGKRKLANASKEGMK
jgi:hypothetical protein